MWVGSWSKWCIPGVLAAEKLRIRVSGEVVSGRVGRASTWEMAYGRGPVKKGGGVWTFWEMCPGLGTGILEKVNPGVGGEI